MLSRAALVALIAFLAAPSLARAQQLPNQQQGAGQNPNDAIPLTPDMIRQLGQRYGATKRAEEEAATQVAAPVNRRVSVSFAPGQATSIIQTVKGYPTALSFFDNTGQPWPIQWDTNSNPAAVAGGTNCNASPNAGGPAVAAVGFYVCTPVKGSNVLEITPMSLQPRGGLAGDPGRGAEAGQLPADRWRWPL